MGQFRNVRRQIVAYRSRDGGRSRLPDNGYLYLTGELDFGLNPSGNVLRNEVSVRIVDFYSFNDNAEFPPCVDGVSTFNSLETVRNLFEMLEATNIGVKRSPTRPGTRRRDAVGDLQQHCDDASCLHRFVVRFYRVENLNGFAVSSQHTQCDVDVVPFDEMFRRLADVVEEARATRVQSVFAELCRERAR